METGQKLICHGVALAMLVPPVLIKDRTVVGASDKIERMPIT